MAYRMCTDCSEYSAAHGMNAHPYFETEFDWLMHLHKSHGGPVPTPTRPNTTRTDKSAGPVRSLGMVQSSDPAGVPLAATVTVLEAEAQALKAQIVELQAQVAGQAAINEATNIRLLELENMKAAFEHPNT